MTHRTTQDSNPATEPRDMKPEREAMPTRGRHITLAHGGGGRLTDDLIAQSILPKLANEALNDLLDSALIDLDPTQSRLAMTIDGYVVQPMFFPGGDIGRLAVSGTVNDLAVCGARPIGLAVGMILAEGLSRDVLECVVESIAQTAREAGVKVLTGDTKVVGRGQGDGIYLTTAGVGLTPVQARLHPDRVRPSDVVLINGTIADHGLAVMLAREMPQVSSPIRSDVAPLNGLIGHLLAEVGPGVCFMRDATRGGLASVAAELARRSGFNVELDEPAIPVSPQTLHAAEMLGLDPLEVANEGKVVVVVRPECAGQALAALRSHPLGRGAAVIGRMTAERDGICELITEIGGRRILAKPYGEQLPRIC